MSDGLGMSAAHERIDIPAVDPAAYQAVYALEKYVRDSGLEPGLYELIKIRASQLNGCAFCLDMHHRDARKHGEDQRRLDVLPGWREAPVLYTGRERAALALTESLTRLTHEGVPDAVWEAVEAEFDEPARVQLLMAVSAINVWNRLAVAAHKTLPDIAETHGA